MMVLVSIGNTDKTILEALRQPLEEVFGQRVQIGDSMGLPTKSWNQHRGQYLASLLLAELPSLPHPGDKVLGVADIDIFAPGLNFVFGLADIGGKRALISLQRLRQEFYGLPRDENLFGSGCSRKQFTNWGTLMGLGIALTLPV